MQAWLKNKQVVIRTRWLIKKKQVFHSWWNLYITQPKCQNVPESWVACQRLGLRMHKIIDILLILRWFKAFPLMVEKEADIYRGIAIYFEFTSTLYNCCAYIYIQLLLYESIVIMVWSFFIFFLAWIAKFVLHYSIKDFCNLKYI